jgi:putative N6-adenine-specific DNA methylase
MECVATCRPGLEGVLEKEISDLGGESPRRGKRAVSFSTDKGGLYRMNMAVRTAIQILVPLRTFNARDYKWLYHQARRTNWHQYFTADKNLRIDVNGRSHHLSHSQYVIHRIKDGIVDTFRKLSGGVRPSIDKRDPEVHVVAHLHGDKVTLCLDSSGAPLFKRGYRIEHGEAPIKEDLAAGILLLSGIEDARGVIDPMCGSGTFLFEAGMILAGEAPNLDRSFAFQHWLDYDPELYEEQREKLRRPAGADADLRELIGFDSDPAALGLARRIQETSFPGLRVRLEEGAFEDGRVGLEGAWVVTNPPYGVRLQEGEDLGPLYRDLGRWAQEAAPGGRFCLFTTNRKAARQIRMRADTTCTLFNGALEGVLYQYGIRGPRS